MRKISERQSKDRGAREGLALNRVIQWVGSQAKVGAHFGITGQAVQQWFRNRVPVMYCAPLETMTGGRVRCEELREDYRVWCDRPCRRVGSEIWRPGDPERAYLSGPMSGLPDLNYPAFNAEAARLRALDIEVVNPAEINVGPGASWRQFMRADIAAMMACNSIILLPGWEASRGANLEFHNAREIGDFKVLRAGEAP